MFKIYNNLTKIVKPDLKTNLYYITHKTKFHVSRFNSIDMFVFQCFILRSHMGNIILFKNIDVNLISKQ